ncbi:hypothetical protein [Actinomycetospora soli]|uniref:hypothetical protein n=1 Tax=Actinomycetospora soli TaxID=2893887 RepID=UPI001E45C8C0|nr:hypothetical protein [Actinomycetospora soli]MCD2191623.1 hypothetical protein [Actinomycetospora soli]
MDARERRLVRRAVRTAVPPAERRLALVAAQRLTAWAGQWYLPSVYLFGASVFAGLPATSTSTASLTGVVWAFGGPLMLAVALWARRQLRRLEQAWQDGRRIQ